MVRLISMLTVLLLACLFLGGTYFLVKKGSVKTKTVTRILAILFLSVMTARYLWDHVAIFEVRGLNMYSPFGDDIAKTVLSVFLIWFSYAAMFTLVLGEFYSYRALRHITAFFSAPVFLLSLVFWKTYVVATLGVDGYTLSDIRVWGMMLECAVAISLPLIHILIDGEHQLPDKKETKAFLAILPFAILSAMPTFVPQALFGFVDASVKIQDLTQYHRIVLYFSVILPFILFHVLKDKSEDIKRFVMLYFSYTWLWTYLSYRTLLEWIDPLNWPIHLCNTAMFIIPLCLLFRWEKVFNFCLFINVLGAFLAMIMPNTSSSVNAIGADRINFWVNHYFAFFMPILLIALKLFRRPRFREWVYSQIAFAVYFLLVLVLNAWFSNYGSVDYFFLNSDFIVEKLGEWAERTRDITWEFNIGELKFVFYPLYQALFYLVYVVVSVGIWFLYALLFVTWDKAEDRRLRERDFKEMKKRLKEFLGGRTIHEPANGDATPRMILKNFSKRYGSNKHYSVKDVSFEVKAGEIFGFLGPNGAGKSTIIKSVVGIQTITSGEIEICGYNVEMQPVQAKQYTGFVPDHYALYENLTGREYVNYIADLFQVPKCCRDEIIEKYVARFQLTGSFDNQMKTYSHGMKQKITIMAALVHDPKVWILDEPLTGLDPTSIFEVKECMKEHAAAGNIVFFSSHIIDVVEKICDRIAIIKKGRLRAITSLAELEASGTTLEQFYLDIINRDDEEDEAPVAVTPTVEEGSLA